MYNAYDNASRNVDLPAPFSPITKVSWCLFKCISVKLFPYDRKFLNLIFSNVIIIY